MELERLRELLHGGERRPSRRRLRFALLRCKLDLAGHFLHLVAGQHCDHLDLVTVVRQRVRLGIGRCL